MPKGDEPQFPRRNQPAIKPDITLRREAEDRELAEREKAERERAARNVIFVSDPPQSGAENAVGAPAE